MDHQLFPSPDFDLKKSKVETDMLQPKNLTKEKIQVSVKQTMALSFLKSILLDQQRKSSIHSFNLELSQTESSENLLSHIDLEKKVNTDINGQIIKANGLIRLNSLDANPQLPSGNFNNVEDYNKGKELFVALNFRTKVIKKINSFLKGHLTEDERSKMVARMRYIEKIKRMQKNNKQELGN